MTKEMTPSIGENQIKSKLDIFLHTHWRQEVYEVHIRVHSEPKPKGVSS